MVKVSSRAHSGMVRGRRVLRRREADRLWTAFRAAVGADLAATLLADAERVLLYGRAASNWYREDR